MNNLLQKCSATIRGALRVVGRPAWNLFAGVVARLLKKVWSGSSARELLLRLETQQLFILEQLRHLTSLEALLRHLDDQNSGTHEALRLVEAQNSGTHAALRQINAQNSLSHAALRQIDAQNVQMHSLTRTVETKIEEVRQALLLDGAPPVGEISLCLDSLVRDLANIQVQLESLQRHLLAWQPRTAPLTENQRVA